MSSISPLQTTFSQRRLNVESSLDDARTACSMCM